jgi:GNAT superfamily N-acetyltransferase
MGGRRMVMPVVEGPRGCRPAELAGVIGLVDAAMRQGSPQTMLTDYPLVYAPANLPNVQVVLVDGRPVATAPVLPRRVEGDGFGFGLGVISPTATDPAHQHRGHGSACVAECVRRMEGLGLELSVLWTQVATFPFYDLNGWQAVERYGGSYRLTREDAGRFGAWTGTIGSLAEHPGRLSEVLAHHVAAGPGIVRTPADAAALFSLPKMTTWLALSGDRVHAYLIESRATNKPGLLEAAGDPAAIAGLVRHVLERLPADASVDLQLDFAPDGLAGVARAALEDRTPAPFEGNMMLRLNDPTGFLRGIRGWLAGLRPADRRSVSIHVADADVTVSLEWRAFGLAVGSQTLPEHVELTRRELTSVIFGPHPARPFTAPEALAWFPRFRVPIPVLDRS